MTIRKTAEIFQADVAILGTGIAGFSVAESLLSAGKKVVMLSPAHSLAGAATVVSSGVWDIGSVGVAHWRDGVSYRDFIRSQAWLAPLGDLLLNDGTLFGNENVIPFSHWHSDSKVFSPLYRGEEDRPALLPVESGEFRVAYAAQIPLMKADATGWHNKKIGIVVCSQWREPIELWIPEWKERLRSLAVNANLVPFRISLKGFDWPISQLASRLAADPTVAALFKEQVIRGFKETPVDFLLFPPLFAETAFVADLEREMGIKVGEFLSPTEPLSGMRLGKLIEEKQLSLGIERIPILSSRQPSLRQNSFFVTSAFGEPLEIKTKAVVLCTGKFLGGGLGIGKRISETVLGLPVFFNRHRGAISYRDQLKSSEDLFRLGLWLDEWHRPRSQDGTLAENLFASGSLVGGVDFAVHRYGLGFFSWLGRACGKKVAEWLG